MHDIRAVRADAAAFDAAMRRRGLPECGASLLELDAAHRLALSEQHEFQARRKTLAREIGNSKRAGANTSSLEDEAITLRQHIELIDNEVAIQAHNILQRIAPLPNVLDQDVPDGRDETDNVVLKRWGTPPQFTFICQEHYELGEALDLMDFANAAKIAGSRFTVLRGALARLERALGQFMMDMHTGQHDYEEASVPFLVNDAAVFGTGQLPKFEDDLFKTKDGRWLIPTAEVPLTNLVAGEILPEAVLPIRRCALTDCFRSEAGSAGRDTRGMLRQHQFRKVELVTIAHPDHSDAEHERMTRCAEVVLEALNLPYRRMFLCAGDTGFSAARTYDLEVWLPGQNTWREISSCSNTRAFQARRMNARFRGAGGVAHVHTLNGSGVAVGRALIAVMENYQREDGSIAVPEALRTYMGGLKVIGRP